MIGRPELAEDPRFASFADRNENADALIPMLEAIFRTRKVGAWLPELRAASIPCGPIYDIPQALAEEHTRARGLIVSVEHPKFGTIEELASPVRVGNSKPGLPAGSAARRGRRGYPSRHPGLRRGADHRAVRR